MEQFVQGIPRSEKREEIYSTRLSFTARFLRCRGFVPAGRAAGSKKRK